MYLIKQWEVDLETAEIKNHLVWHFNIKDTAVFTVHFLRWQTSASRWQPLSLVCNNLNSSDACGEVYGFNCSELQLKTVAAPL